MRNISFFILFLGFSMAGIAKELDLPTLKKIIWGNQTSATQIMDIPEKWANESAVILYREIDYFYLNKKINVDYQHSLRKRIKLLDKSAVETFSEFSFAETFKVEKGFRSKGGKVIAAFKLIKPDGTEKEIDLDNAIEIEGEDGESLKKVAIPDLEPGDILDYFYYVFEPFRTTTGVHYFEPVRSTILDDYPILKQKISLHVDEDFMINFNSYNGAPELETATPSDIAHKSLILDGHKDVISYQIVDENRDKIEEVSWLHGAKVFPIVKFSVLFNRMGYSSLRKAAFVGDEGEVKKKVSQDEVKSSVEDFLLPFYKLKKTALGKHLKEKGLYLVPGKEKEMVEEAYYFERYHNVTSTIENENYGIVPTSFFSSSYNEQSFIKRMANLLDEHKIDYEVLVIVPRNLGGLDYLLFPSEMTSMIKINWDEPYYLSTFHLHSVPGSFSGELEGGQAYVFKVKDRSVNNKGTTVLPVSSHEKNHSHEVTHVSVNEDMNRVSIQRTVSHSGQNKSYSQYRFIKPYEFVKEDFDYFDDKMETDYDDRRHTDSEYKERIAATLQKEDETQLENFKETAESELKVSIQEYKSAKILSYGRMLENPDFTYQEEFEVEDLLKKAGPNYIVDLPKLIGSQVGLEEKDINRKYDVYYDYPRSYYNEVSLEIPEGYSVSGLEKLNVNIDNEMGYFISSAEVEGSTLTLKTQKGYKTNYISVEDWPKAVSFLEAAFQFTQERILLKKE